MNQNKTNHFLVYALASISIFLFFYALFRRLDNDEFEAIHTTWKVIHDGTIYVDFFQHHHPFLYYFLAPFMYMFGATTKLIYLFRFCMYLMFLSIGAGTYKIARSFSNTTIALLSPIFLFCTPIFTIKAIEIRPDVPMTLFIIWAIYCWIRYQQTNKKSYLYLNGFFFGAAFLFLQKAGFIMPFAALLFLADVIKKRITIKETLQYIACGISLPAMYALYLFATHAFMPYFTCNWIFNHYMVGGAPALPMLVYAIGTNALVWIFFAWGLFAKRDNLTFNLVRYFAISFIIILLLVPYSYQQYLMPAMPLIAIIAAHMFYQIAHTRHALFCGLLLLIAIPPFFTNYARRMWISPIMEQIQKINYVLSVTEQTDKILDSELGFNACNVFRPDIDYMWLGVAYSIPTYNKIEPYQYDVYSLIEKHKPKVIGKLSVTKIPPEYKNPEKAYVIERYYKPSKKYPDILVRK